MIATVNDLNTTSNVEIIEVRRYYPPGVSEIIGRGGESFIGVLDEFTVLKYPCIPGNHESIQTEARLLEILGGHPRSIASKGLTKDGLVLQRAWNGCLNDYIISQPTIPLTGACFGANKLPKQSALYMENMLFTAT